MATTDPTEFAFPALAPPPPAPTARELSDQLAAAHDEAERIRAAAHEAGWVAGHAEGRAAARAALAPAAEALAEALRTVQDQGRTLAEALERDAIELALLLAEKVVAAAVDAAPGRVLDVVRGALRGLVDRRRVTVLVHPDDLELVRGAVASLAAELGGIEHLDVQAERRVGRGGALLRTAEGEVDARLEERLARAAAVVREQRGAA
ncbi:FliH/SctL family protein [Patulibacter defluvii]|uniref:FliH/SctL family protein n=1 Tax=Patulibacter defluvii TaxID=3095358 RepID=UPI002A762CFC|nr:FliH/SctL family protein [Patulibacter sp. DM4]